MKTLSLPRPARRVGARCVFLLAIGVGLAGPASAQLPPEQSQGSVRYVSGGFGQEESSAFKAAQTQWPLALTFASADGSAAAYAGDVQVKLVDQSGTTVLEVVSKGPYFLARPPEGDYEVHVAYEGERQSRKVTVGSSKNSPLVFRFARPASGSD